MKLVLVLFLSLGSLFSIAGLNWDVAKLSDYLGYGNYTEVEGLTSDESWAVMAYGFTDETDYQDINGYLRYGDEYDLYNLTPKSVSKLINDVISTANKLPLIPKGLIVYRGFKLNFRDGKCFKKGEVISDKAFISTTLSQKTAKHFAFNRGEGVGAFLTLELASEQKGIFITENQEAEVLLMPNRKLTITDSYLKDGNCYSRGTIGTF